MRYINEEVHEPHQGARASRVNEEKSRSLSDGKAKGARARASRYNKTGLDSCEECEEKRGKKDRYDLHRDATDQDAADNNYYVTMYCYYTPIRVPIRGYASTVITGITPDSYSCT